MTTTMSNVFKLRVVLVISMIAESTSTLSVLSNVHPPNSSLLRSHPSRGETLTRHVLGPLALGEGARKMTTTMLNVYKLCVVLVISVMAESTSTWSVLFNVHPPHSSLLRSHPSSGETLTRHVHDPLVLGEGARKMTATVSNVFELRVVLVISMMAKSTSTWSVLSNVHPHSSLL